MVSPRKSGLKNVRKMSDAFETSEEWTRDLHWNALEHVDNSKSLRFSGSFSRSILT